MKKYSNTNPLQTSPLSGGDLNPKFILYKKELVSRAREFRKNQTISEKKFWEEILKNKNITGYKFTRQKPLDNFIADFYCAKLLLVIEIDGEIHNKTTNKDVERAKILEFKYNIETIRFKNEDVLHNIDLVLNNLKKEIELRERFLKS